MRPDSTNRTGGIGAPLLSALRSRANPCASATNHGGDIRILINLLRKIIPIR
jgi:hypothetical protein